MTISTLFGERISAKVAAEEAREVQPAPRLLVRQQHSASRWLILAFGVAILATGPAIARLCIALERPSVGLLFACSIPLAGVPAIVVAICATLNWRPTWQRFLLFGAALAIQPASYFVFMCSHPPTNRELSLFWLGPLIVMAGGLPAFLFRLWLRWVVVPPGVQPQPQPASINSLLLITGLWAAAAACTQWINADGWFANDPEVTSSGLERIARLAAVAMFVLAPAAFIGLVLVLVLRAALIADLAKAFGLVFAIAIATLAIATGVVVLFMHLAVQVNNGPPFARELWSGAVYANAIFLTALAIGLASFLVLRLLDYRIIHRGMMLESPKITH